MVERIRTGLFLLVAAAMVAGAVGWTRAAFSAPTASAANRFEVGTVTLSDNASGGSVLSLAGAIPGATDTGCIHVTFGGTLPSAVRLFADVSGGLAPYLTLTVTRGTEATPAFESCGGFTPDATDYIGAGAGVLYTGSLAGYPTTYDAGIVDPATWTTGTASSYRFAVTLANNPAAAAQSASATFRWEARNL